VLAALSIALAVTACGGDDDTTSEVVPGQTLRLSSTGGLTVGTIRLDGAQINRGPNVFHVDFEPTTTEVRSASTLMPAHGHGSIEPSLARDGDGYRISDCVFSMPGLWEVRLELAIDGRADRLVFNADAP